MVLGLSRAAGMAPHRPRHAVAGVRAASSIWASAVLGACPGCRRGGFASARCRRSLLVLRDSVRIDVYVAGISISLRVRRSLLVLRVWSL